MARRAATVLVGLGTALPRIDADERGYGAKSAANLLRLDQKSNDESELPDQSPPALDLRPIYGVVVARRQKPARVIRKRAARQVRGEEIGAGMRAHDPEARECAEDICSLDGERSDEGPVFARRCSNSGTVCKGATGKTTWAPS